MNYILLPCKKTHLLGNLLFTLFGVRWVIHGLMKEIFSAWLCDIMGKRCRR